MADGEGKGRVRKEILKILHEETSIHDDGFTNWKEEELRMKATMVVSRPWAVRTNGEQEEMEILEALLVLLC
ncbi:hypothetical protein V6N11_036921 [Hibiscus sabdariffa]|uniref:Uncharacterized protein n=1 Tax=Hibiscus sabdariffa TaxID=183260 RepID=A0ABR2RBT0_9ROSI